MNPIVLLAGAAVALLVLASGKSNSDPKTCLPLAARRTVEILTKAELIALATMARQNGDESVAACLEALAAGGECPMIESEMLKVYQNAPPEILRGFASSLRQKGEGGAADCLDALAKEKEIVLQ